MKEAMEIPNGQLTLDVSVDKYWSAREELWRS